MVGHIHNLSAERHLWDCSLPQGWTHEHCADRGKICRWLLPPKLSPADAEHRRSVGQQGRCSWFLFDWPRKQKIKNGYHMCSALGAKHGLCTGGDDVKPRHQENPCPHRKVSRMSTHAYIHTMDLCTELQTLCPVMLQQPRNPAPLRTYTWQHFGHSRRTLCTVRSNLQGRLADCFPFVCLWSHLYCSLGLLHLKWLPGVLLHLLQRLFSSCANQGARH